MTNEEQFDALQAEINESRILIEKGVQFKVKKQSLLKYLSKNQERNFIIQQPFLGTLDLISELFLKINFDEELIKANPLSESKLLVSKTAKICSLVVAISVLNNRILIKLFSKILASYFLWRLKPSDLFNIALIINQINNYGDFTNSIRLMSIIRTTAPNLIEKKQAV